MIQGENYIIKESSFRDSLDLRNHVLGHTMLGDSALSLMYELAIEASSLEGDVAEAGVYKGGTSYILASVMQDKIVHCFDSWDGLPEIHDFDIVTVSDSNTMPRGWGKTDVPVEFLSKFGDRIKFHKGWFKHQFPANQELRFCLVHVDVDRYISARKCIKYFWPRMVKGGILTFDDYMFELTPGVEVAVDEFIAGYMEGKDYCLWTCGARPIIKVL